MGVVSQDVGKFQRSSLLLSAFHPIHSTASENKSQVQFGAWVDYCEK